MKTLHILNGEATKALFVKSGITGDISVWNEALICGPVQPQVGTNDFWQTRARYIVNSYKGYFQKGPDLQDYEKHALDEFEIIAQAGQYDETILWFEYDLFCQVNMIALLSWLYLQNLNNTQIHLVCIDQFPGHPHFKGLGELNPEDFTELMKQKIRLSQQDLQFAHKAWLAYANPNPHDIQNLLTKDFPAAFPFLSHALKIHLQRFPSPKNGLNHLQTRILILIQQEAKEKKKLVGKMLTDDFQYGFGDVQYFEMLYQLQRLYDNHQDELSLNAEGNNVLSGTQHFLDIEKSDFPLGGANGRKYSWDEQSGTLARADY